MGEGGGELLGEAGVYSLKPHHYYLVLQGGAHLLVAVMEEFALLLEDVESWSRLLVRVYSSWLSIACLQQGSEVTVPGFLGVVVQCPTSGHQVGPAYPRACQLSYRPSCRR